MTAVNASRRVEGPSKDQPAQALVDAGFAWEIADAPLLHHGLNLADIAHVLDLRHRGIIPNVRRGAARGPARDPLASPTDFPYDAAYGEPYNSRERHFVGRIGDDAGWLHAGRPRREAARVALRILLRRLTASSSSRAARVRATTLVERPRCTARSSCRTRPTCSRPSRRPSATTSLGFVPPALRDGERLLGALAQVNSSPGGAGCVNGSRLLADREVIADLARLRRGHHPHARRHVADRQLRRRPRHECQPAVATSRSWPRTSRSGPARSSTTSTSPGPTRAPRC